MNNITQSVVMPIQREIIRVEIARELWEIVGSSVVRESNSAPNINRQAVSGTMTANQTNKNPTEAAPLAAVVDDGGDDDDDVQMVVIPPVIIDLVSDDEQNSTTETTCVDSVNLRNDQDKGTELDNQKNLSAACRSVDQLNATNTTETVIERPVVAPMPSMPDLNICPVPQVASQAPAVAELTVTSSVPSVPSNNNAVSNSNCPNGTVNEDTASESRENSSAPKASDTQRESVTMDRSDIQRMIDEEVRVQLSKRRNRRDDFDNDVPERNESFHNFKWDDQKDRRRFYYDSYADRKFPRYSHRSRSPQNRPTSPKRSYRPNQYGNGETRHANNPVAERRSDSNVTVNNRMDGFVDNNSVVSEAKILLSKKQAEVLLSTEKGFKFLRDAQVSYGMKVRVEYEQYNNTIILTATKGNQIRFNTDLMNFLNEARLEDPVSVSHILPKSRRRLVEVLQCHLRLLDQPCGNVDHIFESLKNMECIDSKTGVKQSNRLRKELNIILFGRFGMRGGRRHLVGIRRNLTILQNSTEKSVPPSIYEEVNRQFNYIFSSYRHDDYTGLIAECRKIGLIPDDKRRTANMPPQLYLDGKRLQSKIEVVHRSNDRGQRDKEIDFSRFDNEPSQRYTTVRE